MPIVQIVQSYIKNTYHKFLNNINNFYRQNKYTNIPNKDITIISNNCLGGVLYHEMGRKFLSPTINLWFEDNDYLLFLHNLNNIKNKKLYESHSHNANYPIGYLIADNGQKIFVRFTHYDNFSCAKKKWIDRCNRINYNNLYIIFEGPLFHTSIDKKIIIVL